MIGNVQLRVFPDFPQSPAEARSQHRGTLGCQPHPTRPHRALPPEMKGLYSPKSQGLIFFWEESVFYSRQWSLLGFCENFEKLSGHCPVSIFKCGL